MFYRNLIMVITKEILDELTAQAKDSPRLRMNYDLRDTSEDESQRMLNAIEPGTVMPIHRHMASLETIVCIRGHFQENLYDAHGNLVETIDMLPGGAIVNVPAGQWHNLVSKESGTVLFEAKNGKYEPLRPEEIFE